MAKMDIKCTSVRVSGHSDGIVAHITGVDPLRVADSVSDVVSEKMDMVEDVLRQLQTVRSCIAHLTSEVDYALSTSKGGDKTAAVASLEDIKSVVAVMSKAIA